MFEHKRIRRRRLIVCPAIKAPSHVANREPWKVAESSAGISERRRGRRTRLRLRGRFLLSDGGEHPCETVDVSVTGLAVGAHILADLGERVVVYLDELGRFEGVVVRRGVDWFAIDARTPRARMDRLAEKLAALSGESGEFCPSGSLAASARTGELRTEFGQSFPVGLCDQTRFGVRVLADFRLLPGVRVSVDRRPAVVVRETNDGFVVEFSTR